MPYEQRSPHEGGVISSKQNLFSTFYTVDRIKWARIIFDYLLLVLRDSL
jgi:hypothetical protein